MPKLPRVHRSPDPNRLGYACTVCRSHDTGVIDSRPVEGGYIRRRRRCNECTARFSTVEVPYEAFEAIMDEGPGLGKVIETFNTAIALLNNFRRGRREAMKVTKSLNTRPAPK